MLVPEIPGDARALLGEVSPDALETLESIGLPDNWSARFRADLRLSVSGRFRDWTSPFGDGPIGEACVIARNPIPLRAPSFEEWVIASDGRVVLCSVMDDESAVYSYNSGYSAFLVFVTALRATPYCDEHAVMALLRTLSSLDSAAFGLGGAWELICAEWAYGDPAKDDEVRTVRRVALGPRAG